MHGIRKGVNESMFLTIEDCELSIKSKQEKIDRLNGKKIRGKFFFSLGFSGF